VGGSFAIVTRVAIACQGGGSHTAFTAGALKGLLRPGALAGREIVGLSGTSGGAVCALLAWSALRERAPERVGELLDAFWADTAASSPPERALNAWTVWASSLQEVVTLPAVSPYDTPLTLSGADAFKRALTRLVDFGAITADGAPPLLIVGAVDVLSGRFRTFDSRRERISAEMILASAAVPTLFRSVRLDDGVYWDGLFSQNPPVRELVDARPDEIWVVQINAQAIDAEPRSVIDIADRRNELAGNLSLNQELHFIEKIDQMLEAGDLPRGGRYKTIVVRVIELSRPRFSRSLGPASKLNRDPAFLAELIAHGEAQAGEFLAALDFEDAWRRRDVDALAAFFADDAVLASAAPFGEHAHGDGKITPQLLDRLARGLTLDLTRKQIARDRVTWTVRAGGPGERVAGRAEATFRSGRVVAVTLGSGTTG